MPRNRSTPVAYAVKSLKALLNKNGFDPNWLRISSTGGPAKQVTDSIRLTVRTLEVTPETQIEDAVLLGQIRRVLAVTGYSCGQVRERASLPPTLDIKPRYVSALRPTQARHDVEVRTA